MAQSVAFEFWNDRSYQPYGPADQAELNARLAETPRPNEVPICGGRYLLRDFACVERGHAIQVNLQTGFERCVRLKPPYRLPGAAAAQLPPQANLHFQFEDGPGRWRSYSDWLQRELSQLVRSAPPPKQFFFAELGKPYLVIGLDSVVDGAPTIVQINVKTKMARKVHMSLGPPVPVAPLRPPPAAELPAAFGAHAAPAHAANPAVLPRWAAPASSAGPAAADAGGGKDSGARMVAGAQFYLSSARRSSNDRPQRCTPDMEGVLRELWRREPRPDSFELPCGGGLVERFGQLETGGCRLRRSSAATPSSAFSASAPVGRQSPLAGGYPSASSSSSASACGSASAATKRSLELRLELRLPPPVNGRIDLPASLDVAPDDSGMASYGRYLTDEEVGELNRAGGSEASTCSICLCELEAPEAQDNNACSNADPGGKVFLLQCGHAYHAACLEQWFRTRRRCPRCQKDFGKRVGDQPRAGSLEWFREPQALPGHDAKEMIVIQFTFPAGTRSAWALSAARPRCTCVKAASLTRAGSPGAICPAMPRASYCSSYLRWLFDDV
eukprot:TRINITY_DN17948_c0_g2_i1.p1 TRINITY_DN17948_c0_g2~~TRINITY_DN17948_c0_g2_i1.p1  ORF type:complete len:607 (-),score=92.98 TRINITY_DN17948_c0_g2_i1:261-1931(-)